MESTTLLYKTPQVKRCAFTGYRPHKMPFGYDEQCPLALDFKKRLRDTLEMLIQQGYKHLISGGAQGMDLMAAEIALDLKDAYPDIILEMAIPFEEQAAKWDRSYQARWKRCVGDADMITLLSHDYTKSCLFERNRYMVQQADLLLACFDGQDGGTKMTVEYARRSGCPVCLISPARKSPHSSAS